MVDPGSGTKREIEDILHTRYIVLKNSIMPEDLPAEEDLKKMERKQKTEDKKRLKNTERLKPR